jgi:hypothetical protein
MLKPTADIMLAKLIEIFAPLDARVLAGSQAWAKARVAALREFKNSDEGKSMRRDVWRYYDRLYDIAGGKIWYNVFNGHNTEGIEKFIEKNCIATADKRNSRILAKLKKTGVTAVESFTYANTADGFNGVFEVRTDAELKHINIDTILVGGYNVQCLHLRVLVNVK